MMTPGPKTHLEYFDTEPQHPGDLYPWFPLRGTIAAHGLGPKAAR